MTLQTTHAWRVRPVCDICGWRGTWRVSRIQTKAERVAAAQLQEHLTFWHEQRQEDHA